MIYLDHNATSPLLPEVLLAMQPWLGVPCNPSSVHQTGQRAAIAVDQARAQVALLVGARPEGVVFTSGATEANHAWFHAMGMLGRAERVAVAATEHPCVHAAAQRCAVVHTIGVDRLGLACFDGLPEVDGVSVMAANHETGVVQPLQPARGRGWVHVDATAAAGRMPLDLGWADAVVLSAHKLGGPMGVGALVLRNGDALPALLGGGSQERGRRAGTVNTPGVVGFGAACRLAADELESRRAQWTELRTHLIHHLRGLGGRVVGGLTVPSVVNVVFEGLPAETLVQALDLHGIAVSAGAACASGSIRASPVLRAMGEPEPAGGVRISMGPRTSQEDIDGLVHVLPDVLGALRLVL